MKIILLILPFFFIFSCTNNEKELEVNEIKQKIQENTNTGTILKAKEKKDIQKIIYSSKLSLQERLELIRNDDNLKQQKYLEKDGSVEGSKIKIIRGENSFDYSFKHIEKEGIEIYGTGLSKDIKSITITPIIYGLDNDLNLDENELYKSDYIDKESFRLKGYKIGEKSFKYNAFYKYKNFTPSGMSLEIKYEFKNGTKGSDFIFVDNKIDFDIFPKGVDFSTYEEISQFVGKDKNKVYFLGGAIGETSENNLNKIKKIVSGFSTLVYSKGHYLFDENNIYFMDTILLRNGGGYLFFNKLNDVDIYSFNDLGNFYYNRISKDKNKYYYCGLSLDKSNSKIELLNLGNGYFKNGDYIHYVEGYYTLIINAIDIIGEYKIVNPYKPYCGPFLQVGNKIYEGSTFKRELKQGEKFDLEKECSEK